MIEIPGVGLLDVRTVREDGPRLIGNVAIEVSLDGDGARVLAGFENHGGRTYLGEGQQPLGRVLRGHGNDGRSGLEGARSANTDRHLPARSAAAQERVVRRLADRARARHRRRRARAARRRDRARRPTERAPRRRGLTRPGRDRRPGRRRIAANSTVAASRCGARAIGSRRGALRVPAPVAPHRRVPARARGWPTRRSGWPARRARLPSTPRRRSATTAARSATSAAQRCPRSSATCSGMWPSSPASWSSTSTRSRR